MLFTPLREWGEACCVVHSIKRIGRSWLCCSLHKENGEKLVVLFTLLASQKGSDLNALVCNSKFNSKTNYAVESKNPSKIQAHNAISPARHATVLQ